MILNKIFLGDNSVVDISTKATIDDIKLKLASRFSRSRYDPRYKVPGEEDYSTTYVYYIEKDILEIYFSKDMNRVFKRQYSPPWFTGQIIENGKIRRIKGTIGLPGWTYYVKLFGLAFFISVFFASWIWGEGGQGIFVFYIVLFVLVAEAIGLVRKRSKVKTLHEEIEMLLGESR